MSTEGISKLTRENSKANSSAEGIERKRQESLNRIATDNQMSVKDLNSLETWSAVGNVGSNERTKDTMFFSKQMNGVINDVKVSAGQFDWYKNYSPSNSRDLPGPDSKFIETDYEAYLEPEDDFRVRAKRFTIKGEDAKALVSKIQAAIVARDKVNENAQVQAYEFGAAENEKVDRDIAETQAVFSLVMNGKNSK